MPSRFAVIPRRGGPRDIRWFEADPTYVLHFTNAYEDGDEIVLDGFFQGDPEPADNGHGRQVAAGLPLPRARPACRPGCTAGGSTSSPARPREEQLTDSITEFGMINAGYAGRDYRYTYAATGKPGWFLFDGLVKHDLHTGAEERFAFDDGVYGSETAMAPRVGSTGEDDGYLVTLTTDMNADASYCLVFDAARVGRRPGVQTALCPNGSRAAPTRRGRRARSCAAGTQPTPPPRRSACSGHRDRPTIGGETNAVGRMLGLLGDEWTLLILQQALLGATRYGEFTARLPISHAVLTRRLRAMTDDGLLARTVYQDKPTAVRVPDHRRAAGRCGRCWCRSGSGSAAGCPTTPSDLPAMHHTTCGADFAPLLTCGACGDGVTEKDVVAQWGPSGSWPRSMPLSVDAPPVGDRCGTRPGRPVPADHEHPRQPLGVRASGRRVRRHHPVQRLRRPARRAARLAGRPAADLHRQRRARRGGRRYLLTEKGRAVFPVLITALQWAQRWFHAPEGPAVLLRHTACGRAFTAVLACDQCTRPLAELRCRHASAETAGRSRFGRERRSVSSFELAR